MRRKYNKGGKVPSKFKGFSSLPEDVQESMNPKLAKKYKKGGKYKRKKKYKEEGGTFDKLTTPTDAMAKGAGIAGLAGGAIGAASDDNDATTYKAGEVGGDILKGAAAGAAFGPLGMAIGGGAALVGGLVNRNKARKEEKKQKEEERKQQQELTKQNIEQNLQTKETQEEEERVKRSTDALANMAPLGSEGMKPTPMMRKYGGKVGMPPPPPGFMYDKNGNLVRTNRALDIREKGGLIAKKYSIGQMR